MNDQMKEIKERIEGQIEALNHISAEQKDRMKRTLNAIFISQNGRVYLERKSDYQKYLTVRKNDFSGNYDIGVVQRMIDVNSGSIEGTDFQFPGLRGISDIVENNKDLIESEITSAENYRRVQEPQTKESNEGKSAVENYTQSAKGAIQEATNIPAYKKERTYDVMDLLADLPLAKIYSKKDSNYSEAIALKQTNQGYGYYILARTFDDYSGATINRDSTPISARSLVDYVDKHRVELDKEVKRMRRMFPKKESKPQEKSVEQSGEER